jgi:hypothetical protein
MKNQLLVFLLFSSKLMMAQDSTDYFYQIPDYPSTYTATTVVARMVDGLGFRYYWATDGLRTEDLDFSPSEEARTSRETLDHIYSLIKNLNNAVHQVPTIFPSEKESLTFMEKREKTLALLKDISEILKKSQDEDLELFKMIFEGPSYSTEYPFWNELNGPLADALWHVGQVVTFRRSSGNPFNSQVSVLKGELKE